MFNKFLRSLYLSNTIFAYIFLFIFNKNKASQWLFKRFNYLGGIYIKFLQLLALNQDNYKIDDQKKLEEILSVYDHSAFESLDINEFLISELGPKSKQIILDSTSPFAAGSFAQVYSASLNDQSVIIKVLRPSVIRYLRFDLTLLSWIVRLVSFPANNQIIDFVTFFNDFKRLTLEETNYYHEVQNALTFYKKMINHPIIYIPKTYTDFCTKHLIVQEKINGIPLTKIFSLNTQNKSDYVLTELNTSLELVMEELATEMLAGSLQNGGSHGDPHPGNIYILPNNRVALIDFGISSLVSQHQSELVQLVSQYIDVYKGEFHPDKICQAMISYYAPYLTKSIQTVSSFLGKQDLVQKILEEIGKAAAQSIKQQQSDPAVTSMMDDYNMMKIFNQVVNKDNRLNLKISFESPGFIRGTQIFMKITRLLDLDMQLLRRSWERALSEVNISQTSQASADYDNETIDESFHTLACWFDRLRYSDPGLYNRVMQKWEFSV